MRAVRSVALLIFYGEFGRIISIGRRKTPYFNTFKRGMLVLMTKSMMIAVLVVLSACSFSVANSAPNVIIFLMDDFGSSDVGAHPTYFPDGSGLYESPNMHRLASEGMRFGNAYAQPLCSASRFSLLSGQYSAARHCLWAAITAGSVPDPNLPTSSSSSHAYNFPPSRDHMLLEIETIAERLKQAGYATWHAGKWHLSPHANGSNPNPITDFYPDKQGFDKMLSVGGPGPSPGYFGPFTMPEMNDHNGVPAPGTNKDYIAEHMAKLVKGLLDDHLANNPSQPFFLYYPTYSVHGPHQAKASVYNKYVNKLAGLPDSKHQHPIMAAMIEGLDTELGSLLDYMDANGLTNNTLFILVSDNGALTKTKENAKIYDDIGADGIPDDDPLSTVDGTYTETIVSAYDSTPISNNDPLKGGKASIYEGGLRVPMIVRYPNGSVAAGAISNEPVHLIDIYQTILDYTPATPKAGYTLDGVSLKPALEQTAALPARELFHYYMSKATTFGTDPDNPNPGTHPGGAAVLNYPHKMIATYSTAHDAATVDYMLYRLDTDQGEANNIAGLNPTVVEDMRKRLDNFYAETNAFVPTPNPAYDGTSFNSPEITIDNYLADAGLALLTPESFNLADPDGDNRINSQEFLEQTDPNSSDSAVATVWLYDNNGLDELRIAVPAKVDQNTISIRDATGAVVFTPDSGLTLDAQYGPFFVYKPTVPVSSPNPNDYTITVADASLPQSTAEFTVDYRILMGAAEPYSVETLSIGGNLLVDTGNLEIVQEVTVTTTGLSGDIRKGGSHGLAVVGGQNDVWFDSGEEIDLTFTLQTTDGTPVNDLQLELIDVGARAVNGETMTFTASANSTTASWEPGSGDNGRPGTLTSTLSLTSDQVLNVRTGPYNLVNQATQLSYITFIVSDSNIDNTDTDGDLLPDSYESANGLDPNDPADGNTDNDGDGWTRGREYVAGTSDFDANDYLTLNFYKQDDGHGRMESVLNFDVKDRHAYRLYKHCMMVDPFTLIEDFGVISGDHSVQLTIYPDCQSEYYELVAYPIGGDTTPVVSLDMTDFALLSLAWLSDDTPTINWNEYYDLDDSGEIDINDLLIFSEYWLMGY